MRTLSWRGQLVSLVAILALVLVACAPAAEEPVAEPVAEPVEEEPVEEEPAEEPAEVTEIVFWTMLDHAGEGVREVAERTMVENFEAQNPDVRVHVESTPFAELPTKTILAVAAGSGPDVVRVSFSRFREYTDAGTLRPLDDLVADWTEEQKADFGATWGATMFEGQKMTFIIAPLINAIMYRTDLFEATGLDEPRTWDEFAQVASAMTTENLSGFVMPLQRTNNLIDQFLYPCMWGAGGQPYTPDGFGNWNSAEGMACVEYLVSLIEEHQAIPPEAVQFTLDDALEGLRAGVFASHLDGSNRWAHANDSEATRGRLGLWPIPSFDGQRSSPPQVLGWSLGITSTSQKVEAAWRFIQHVMSHESQLINAQVAGEVPTRVSVLEDPWFDTEEAAHIQWYLSYLGEHPDLEMPHPRKVGQWREIMAGAIHDILLDGVPVQQALDSSVDAYNAAILEDD